MTQEAVKINKKIVKKHAKSVWLIKQDARLLGNKAINCVSDNSTEVLPVFCFEPLVYRHPDYSHFHHVTIMRSLQYLQEKIEEQGGHILFLHGDICTELSILKKTYDFSLLVSHEEVGLKHTYDHDKELKEWCRKNNILWQETVNNGIKRVLKNRDVRMNHWNHHIQDTPFLPVDKNALWTQLRNNKTPCNKTTTTVPFEKEFKVPEKGFQICSENNALFTLNDFLENRSKHYRGGISSMNRATKFGSQLSIHLAWGTVSMCYGIKVCKIKLNVYRDK